MLTALVLNNKALQPRMMRDATVPLSRITFFSGPNGSGKSTLLDAFCQLVYENRAWTAETAPVLTQGDVNGTVCFFSMEKDNPRVSRSGDFNMGRMRLVMDSQYQSHGQSNFGVLQDLVLKSAHAVLVLDEPESAMDLDGLLWLREALLKTDKQVIVATHSPILLAMSGVKDVSVQVFGPDPEYDIRVRNDYLRLLQGMAVKPVKKRLPRLGLDEKPAPRRAFGAKKQTTERS